MGMKYNKASKTLTISQNTGITVSVALVVMFAGAVFTVATWVQEVRTTGSNNARNIEELQRDVTELKAQDTASQVRFGEIQTQLRNIDTNLLEIKENIMRLQR